MFNTEVLPADKFPKLRAWTEAMLQTDAAKGGATPMEYLNDFFTGLKKDNESAYDVGLE